jgi:hypothetical protein
MVQDGVPVDTDAILVGRLAERLELLLGAPFGADRSLLVEFTEVIEIIDVVPVAILTRGLAAVDKES